MRTSFAALALIGVLFSSLSFAFSRPISRPQKEATGVVVQSAISKDVEMTGVPQSSSLLAPPL